MTKMASSNFQDLIPALSKCLRGLPLHSETQRILETYCRNSSFKSLQVVRDIHEYERYNDQKSLEMLIYRAHFIWNNPLPPYLKRFQLYHAELRNYWPYEFQRSLLSMTNPRKDSQIYLWKDCQQLALSKLRFEKHRWGDESITDRLSSSQRTQLLQSIFHHYLFLKSHSRLCYNNRKPPVPIVEIPLRPMGNDAADCRIRNLFKRRTDIVWNLLAWENRPLSKHNESLLNEIISKGETRSGRRLYQRACKRAYIIKNQVNDSNDPQIPDFYPSEILLKPI